MKITEGAGWEIPGISCEEVPRGRDDDDES